jgi:hypothetical protein
VLSAQSIIFQLAHHCNLHSRLYKLSDCSIVHSYSVTFQLPVPCQPCAFINELSEVLCFPIKHRKMPCFNCELDLKSVGLKCTTCLGSNWNCSNWLCFIAETFKLSLHFTTVNKGNQTHYPITGTLHTFHLGWEKTLTVRSLLPSTKREIKLTINNVMHTQL